MAKFITEHLDIRDCNDDEHYWELRSPLIYDSDLIGRVKIEVPFFTDLASTAHVPFVNFIWGGKAHKEAVLHDFLYRTNSKPVVGFAMANSVFIEAMEARGKSFWVRYPMFTGVWIGGYFSFHEKTVEWRPGDGACQPPDTMTVQP
jgi:hypothetical protein